MLCKREISALLFLFTSPYLYHHIDHRKNKIRQINKVNDRKLSINRFYLFSVNCLNSTNIVQLYTVILLILNANMPQTKIEVRTQRAFQACP